MPQRGDVVLMPEGFEDPLTYGYAVLSGARKILLVLAPPGFVGWPFREGWYRKPAVDISVDEVGLPEHYRAIDAMGFEMWGNSPRLVDRINASGVRGTYIGAGRPVPFEPPLPKRYDVVTFANNRWAQLAREVVARLDPSVTHHEIPPVPNVEVLRQLGQARVLIHPLRIEGDSRIGQEARAMGAVPVVLNTNTYSAGLDEEGGAVEVCTLDDMPGAVMELLNDPDRLADLRGRGMRTARAHLDWEAFVGRVDAALSRSVPEHPGLRAHAAIGAQLRAAEQRVALEAETRERALVDELDRVRAELSHALADVSNLNEALDVIRGTRAWRWIGRYRRVRDRFRRIGRRCRPRR
jgi:hypothetical protein